MSCHDEKATKAVPLIPPLQGQSVVYLAGKLDEFASRDGQNQSALNPMPSIARSLNQQERHDLADYFAAATPLSK
jgi:cytochrome c553